MAKKKINDDTLLQLIRDGNSPVGAENMKRKRDSTLIICLRTCYLVCYS